MSPTNNDEEKEEETADSLWKISITRAFEQFNRSIERDWAPEDETQIDSMRVKLSVDSPPGKIESRVFIAGNYKLMPILRFIENTVSWLGYQPILAYDYEMPREKTRDYTLRLLNACRYAIFEMTLGNGHLVEYVRANMTDTKMLQVYMAKDERKEKPDTLSVMVWQVIPPPEGYCTMAELDGITTAFLGRFKD